MNMQKIVGIIRRIEDLGRVCLPIEYRRALKLFSDEKLEIVSDGEKIIARRPLIINGQIQLQGDLRKFDAKLGRLLIPSEIRKIFKLSTGARVAISIDGDELVLRPLYEQCVFCNSKENLLEFSEENICRGCARAISAKVAI